MDEKNVKLPSRGSPGKWGEAETEFGFCDCPCGQPTSYFKGTKDICWPQTEALRIRALFPGVKGLWLENQPGLVEKLETLGWNANEVIWQIIGLEMSAGFNENDLAVAVFLGKQLGLIVVEVEALRPLRDPGNGSKPQ